MNFTNIPGGEKNIFFRINKEFSQNYINKSTTEKETSKPNMNQTLYLMLFFVSIILLRFVDILQNNVKVAVFCLLVRVFNG